MKHSLMIIGRFFFRFILYYAPLIPFLALFILIYLKSISLEAYLTQYGPYYAIMLLSVIFTTAHMRRIVKFLIVFMVHSIVICYISYCFHAMIGGLSMAVVDGGGQSWPFRQRSYIIDALRYTLYSIVITVPYIAFVVWVESYTIGKILQKWLGRFQKSRSSI